MSELEQVKAERDKLAAEVEELKHLLVVAAADLRTFTKGAGELYALGGEIQDAVIKYLPCGNGPFDRAAAKHIGNIGWQEEASKAIQAIKAVVGGDQMPDVAANVTRLAAEVVSLTGALREANALVAELIKANRREVENNTRLAESIFDHDCPSFSMCPKHIGSRELEECPYCMIERLTARWAALNVKLREVYLEGLDDTGPVAEGYADGVQAALHLMDALEREEAK